MKKQGCLCALCAAWKSIGTFCNRINCACSVCFDVERRLGHRLCYGRSSRLAGVLEGRCTQTIIYVIQTHFR